MKRDCYLVNAEHIPAKAKFPVIDAHNHLWGGAYRDNIARIVAVMDEVGVAAYCDLTGNLSLEWVDGGYEFQGGGPANLNTLPATEHPGRFYAFSTATFTHPPDQPLFTDAGAFVEQTIKVLTEHVRQGAKGLKVLKELGLSSRDGGGELVNIDDERLFPIWEAAGELGIPVLLHQADPSGFFEPVTPANEHYESMKKYPSWSFAGPEFPRKLELLARRDRLVKAHPETRFILAHVANYAENLAYVANLLDENPNVCIDFSARLDELGRQPYSARELFIKYQDRIIFGADMPASPEMYRCYFRFLETCDEGFEHPDYDGTFDRYRWCICGISLPDDVLQKVYHKNILKLIPGLPDELGFTHKPEG